jgi:hypothetical protein
MGPYRHRQVLVVPQVGTRTRSSDWAPRHSRVANILASRASPWHPVASYAGGTWKLQVASQGPKSSVQA